MTPIPDDDPTPQDRAKRAEDGARRLLAAIEGALEGLTMALDEYDVKNEAKGAIEQAGAISRTAAAEARTQAQTPEMQRVGEGLRTAGDHVAQKAAGGYETVAQQVGDLRATIAEGVEDVRTKAHDLKADVQVKADAVAESGRRARRAPGRIGHELGEAYASWKHGLFASLAGIALMALFGITTLIVLTIAMVVGLNELLFDPAGTWIVAGLYALGTLGAWAITKTWRAKAKHETREAIENAKEEVRHVGRPVREAFSRGRSNI